MKTEQWMTSCLAACKECGKVWEDLSTAREQAYNHAKKTGHEVHGEQVTNFSYNAENHLIEQ